MYVLVACEESQRVCTEFRKRRHIAYSCDIIECSGGHPEWHIKSDVIPLLNGNCDFTTMDGIHHYLIGKWDLIIAFPPCTYLSIVSNRCYNVERFGNKAIERIKKREEAATFFMEFVNADCDKIAIENPVGYMSTHYQKPTQYIQPFYFADSVNDSENYHTKKTCLWLKNLPELKPFNDLPRPEYEKYYSEYSKSYKSRTWTITQKGDRQCERSKTFPGVARAMAEQWDIKE